MLTMLFFAKKRSVISVNIYVRQTKYLDGQIMARSDFSGQITSISIADTNKVICYHWLVSDDSLEGLL